MKNMWQERQRFSIRRFSIGAASVLLGTLLAGVTPVGAEEIVDSVTSPLLVTESRSASAEGGEAEESILTAVPTTAPVLEEKEEVPVLAEVPATAPVAEDKPNASLPMQATGFFRRANSPAVAPSPRIAASPEVSPAPVRSEVPSTAPVLEDKPEFALTQTKHWFIRYLPFKTEVIEDANIPFGQEVVETVGQRGNRTWLAERYRDSSGKLLAEHETRVKITPAVNQVVRRGAPVTREGLAASLAAAQSQVATLYTNQSWQAFQERLAAAQTVYNTDQVTQASIDQEITLLDQARAQLIALKAKPVLTVERTSYNMVQGIGQLHYNLTDTANTLTGALAKLYQGGKLIQTLPVQQATVRFANLEQDTPYEVETSLTYDIGNGSQTEIVGQRTPLEVTLKAIEFKNIHKMTVYRRENGKDVRVLSLPSNLDTRTFSQYHVVLETDLDKEVSLPVTSLVKTDTGYKAVMALASLVQKNTNAPGYHNYLEVAIPLAPRQAVTSVQLGNKVIYQFSELIQQLQTNPTGRFVLGADLSAQGVALAAGQPAYVTQAFSGSLDGKNYKIYDLAAPLFADINRGRVSNLHLSDVRIAASTNSAAPLAMLVRNQSLITNLAIDGTISARYNPAGLIHKVDSRSQIKNVAVKARLTATETAYLPYFAGGLIGQLTGGSLLEGASFDGSIDLKVVSDQQRAGAIVADVVGANTRVRRAVAKGSIRNLGSSSQVGGAFGTVADRASVDQVISLVKVFGGTTFLGDKSMSQPAITNAFIVTGQSQGETSLGVTSLSEAEANSKIAQWTPASQTSFFAVQAIRDYSRYHKANPARAIAYRNMEKLLPFYNGEYIVNRGNQLAPTDKLTQTELVSVVAMKGTEFITDYFTHWYSINNLLLNYADGSSETISLSRPRFYQSSPVLEFENAERGLLYTPDQFLRGNIDQLVRDLSRELASMNYFDDVLTQLYPNLVYDGNMLISQKIKMSSNKEADKISHEEATAKLREAKVDPLYLEEAYYKVTPQLETYLKSLISQNLLIVGKLSKVEQTASIQKIRDNKAALLMGLAYMERLYNVQFDDYNIKPLAQFRQDVFGKDVDGLDFLIQLGKSGLENLRTVNNTKTYTAYIGRQNGYQDVFDYLDAFRSRLTKKSNAEWLRSATKAFVVEKASKEADLAAVPTDLYSSLSKPRHRYLLLPLLNVSKDTVFVISNMSTITFGMFEREVNRQLAMTDPAAYQAQLAKAKERIDLEAERQRRHFDLWSRLLDAPSRKALYSHDRVPIPVWNGFQEDAAPRKAWLLAFGSDTAQSINEFFGPTGTWYRPIGIFAHANGHLVQFFAGGTLSNYGHSVFTHEMVHNFDHKMYFNGFNRREGAGAESFATGMFHVVDNPDQDQLGVNFSFDFSDEKAFASNRIKQRVHNLNPERFQNVADLNQYYRRSFDILYSLDSLEAEALIAAGKPTQQKLLKKLDKQAIAGSRHAEDVIRDFTAEEWANLSFSNLKDFVTQDVILGRNNRYRNGTIGTNTYHTTSMFVPIYGALTNENGISGNLTFKRLAFDILGEAGYDGMLSYISSKHAEEAKADKVNLSDTYVINKIFNGKYKDFKEFKYDMLNRRYQALKADKLQVVHFDFKGKTYTSDYRTMKSLFEETLKANPNQLQDLKKAIYTAYLTQTNDFRDDVYRNDRLN